MSKRSYASMWRRIDYLRDIISKQKDKAERRNAQVKRLKVENAKLHELVRDFERYRFGDCQHCGYAEQCLARQTNCYKVHVDLIIRARELELVVE